MILELLYTNESVQITEVCSMTDDMDALYVRYTDSPEDIDFIDLEDVVSFALYPNSDVYYTKTFDNKVKK